ncbi:conjugative transposon protein TraM [Chryseobacterium sp. Ch-15]|uniref:Conjugative transposon protein TraM n=1 Tax=Chryseobacterium muglaense TaxID=2893752 RepID=A0A9Q3YVI5_9FLAO|nr:conjugative transposon protein TraM [Chryseobacterium muglaense]MBD3905383.1 conjugative transposon protein TraM [Chryseobacterium muglaense]MCC9036892.1 conjugative transposon protein TraM [Chryseobacterium muglaense]MCM2555246.1 conjugative transposon protein TraM [Chryseobacterium muglaense]
MREQNNNSVRITEGHAETTAQNESEAQKLNFEKFKKPIIYFLMGVVCLGCLYLIFKPNKEKQDIDEVGFNSMIPQAADDKLQSDKQKAYEQQLLEQKNEEKKNALTTLSDYWTDPATQNATANGMFSANDSNNGLTTNQGSVNSYRNAQQTLGSFYGRDDQEVSNLKREIHRLKSEVSQKETVLAGTGINDQLELMEKSYQMAAKYLPAPVKQEEPTIIKSIENKTEESKIKITAVSPIKRNIISSLYREPSDSLFSESLNQNNFTGLQTDNETVPSQNYNSIRAVVHQTKLLVSESSVALRLSEPMKLGKTIIPPGAILKAFGKFQGGRLQLKISSIEFKGQIHPVEINIHDNDGQLGLYIPYSPEQNALTDIAGNMSQNSGTNIMMTQSAGQQVAADLTRGLVQGASGYFQKKVRLSKVTVKSGHQVFLVSKNN